MTVVLEPHPGESPVSALPVPGSFRGFRFGFVVTAEAVYLPVKKAGVALYEPLVGKRIPLGAVRRVLLVPAPWPTGRLLLYAPMFIFLSFMAWLLARDGTQAWDIALMATCIYGVPLIFTVLGSGGRYRLTVETDGEVLYFAPLAHDVLRARTKAQALRSQFAFVAACQSLGVPVVLQAPPLPQPPA